MPSESEIAFCRRLVEICSSSGISFTPADADRILARVDEIEKTTGRPVCVAEMLFKDEATDVPPSAIARVQNEHKRKIVLCPTCGAKNNVFDRSREKAVKCPACREMFYFSDGLFPVADTVGLPRIEGFAIGDLIMEGGQGAVYRGTRAADGAPVAIKIVQWGTMHDPSDRDRFKREAELAASLDHPAIVRVLHFQAAPMRGILVMEWAGTSVQDRVETDGPDPPPRALALGRALFSGLAYAHAREIVHRDIKPANIMVREDGAVKIVDLGLAKTMACTGVSGITLSGVGMGTPAYMPPEQLTRFRILDARADLYGAGATLYFLLTGHAPYEGKGPAEVQRRLAEGPPKSIRSWQPALPPAIVALIERLMAREPERRPADAGSVIVEIDRILADSAR